MHLVNRFYLVVLLAARNRTHEFHPWLRCLSGVKVRADSGFPVAVDHHRVHGRHGGDHHPAAAQGDAGDEALHVQDRHHLRRALHLPSQGRGESDYYRARAFRLDLLCTFSSISTAGHGRWHCGSRSCFVLCFSVPCFPRFFWAVFSFIFSLRLVPKFKCAC